ncbi:hypothetical protein FA09DRAFT_90948 [Tilletiopsis washingtonensis]|jgi:hypothetical protein|uniref:Uncharacterized protein n=1 Tax=Tilletiopsis washingtonensis TaxID=58919 RepID=A0A316Z5A8_9BASI|nr:hypothetical protein FA09DRAFT_90948 [Tilletiopsis washingtonensis]PWN96496.1 hypothetical protein FA09DRAFT_90948 [Tilletiopsis washingtonensis]
MERCHGRRSRAVTHTRTARRSGRRERQRAHGSGCGVLLSFVSMPSAAAVAAGGGGVSRAPGQGEACLNLRSCGSEVARSLSFPRSRRDRQGGGAGNAAALQHCALCSRRWASRYSTAALPARAAGLPSGRPLAQTCELPLETRARASAMRACRSGRQRPRCSTLSTARTPSSATEVLRLVMRTVRFDSACSVAPRLACLLWYAHRRRHRCVRC